MARIHWRPNICRRNPRPPRSQRPPHRSHRRKPPAQTLQIDRKGLTTSPQLWHKSTVSRGPDSQATSSRNQRATSSESANRDLGDLIPVNEDIELTGLVITGHNREGDLELRFFRHRINMIRLWCRRCRASRRNFEGDQFKRNAEDLGGLFGEHLGFFIERFQRAFVCPRNGSFLTRRWSKPDSNSRSHPLTHRQTDCSDPPYLPTRQIYRSR